MVRNIPKDMFGWSDFREMENEGEKSEEKMMFLVVWLREEKGRDFSRSHKFSHPPLKHNLSKLERK